MKNTKEILNLLLEGLESKESKFMCRLLKRANINTSFLETSGLQEIWKSKNYHITHGGDGVWAVTKDSSMKVDVQAKIECINELLIKL